MEIQRNSQTQTSSPSPPSPGRKCSKGAEGPGSGVQLLWPLTDEGGLNPDRGLDPDPNPRAGAGEPTRSRTQRQAKRERPETRSRERRGWGRISLPGLSSRTQIFFGGGYSPGGQPPGTTNRQPTHDHEAESIPVTVRLCWRYKAFPFFFPLRTAPGGGRCSIKAGGGLCRTPGVQ